jgi:predicted nucleotidyltransferase
MESTRNKLTEKQQIFFDNLSNQLDTKIYFYGSIQRYDYLSKSSDIDICIFTNNEKQTIIQIQNFLNIEKNNFKKTVYKINDKIIHGYKIKYQEPENYIFVEICIYNEKYKDIILNHHKNKINVPFYVSFILLINKFFYIYLGILPKKIFYKIKNFIMDTLNKYDASFVEIGKI